MELKTKSPGKYTIKNAKNPNWYLYSVEQCSYGKRIEWTSNKKDALIFETELSINTYIKKVIPNVVVIVFKLAK